MDVVVNDADSCTIVRGTTRFLSNVRVPFRIGTLSTRHAPRRIRQFTGRTSKQNVQIVVTNTKVTTTLPKIVTTGAALPIVKVPVGKVLSKLSTVLDVVRVPPNVPITAIKIGNTLGTNVLTTRILTLSSAAVHSELTTCGRELGRGVIGTGTTLTRIGCTCGAG